MATTHTGIAWADRTWGPTRGCRRISPGCQNCYAERQAYRFSRPTTKQPRPPYEGLVTLGKNGPRWTGAGHLIVDTLDAPTRWKKPQKIFVDSMSDLFFEAFSFEEIAAVFGVMSACKQHTFQVLTKRSERMLSFFHWVEAQGIPGDHVVETCASNYVDIDQVGSPWPLPNVWLGVSVESQQYADERIPDLLRVPAAVRFVSYEPALEGVDLRPLVCPDCFGRSATTRVTREEPIAALCDSCDEEMTRDVWLNQRDGISWVIVGGESGPGARPFDVCWAESVVRQCREADVACFVKQLGAKPFRSPEHDGATGYELSLKHRKGEDPIEWPEHLRVQEFPTPELDDAPYVCPGCYAVGEVPCLPGCIDDEMRREQEHALLSGAYGDRSDEDDDADDHVESELEMQDRFNAEGE